jgi:predicted nuclease with TOPRIM domain
MAQQPDTDLIRKTVSDMQAKQQREQHDECKNAQRIERLEGDMEEVQRRLGAGDVGFAELRKDIGSLTEKVGTLTSILAWVGGAIGLGLLGTAGSALVWVISQSGKGTP